MALSKLQVSFLLCGLALLSCCFVNGKYTEAQIDYFAKLCNATEEDLVVIKKYDIPSTETGKRYIKCVTEKLGMLDSDGKYSKPVTFEVLKKYWPEALLDTIAKVNDFCFNESSKTISPSEWGTPDYYYKMWVCLNTQCKQSGML